MKIPRSQLRYLWQASAGQRGRIGLSCLTGVVGVALSLGFIWATKLVIDIATSGGPPGTVGGMSRVEDELPRAAVLAVALLVAQLLCNAADTWLGSRLQVETGNAIRHRLFRHLLRSRWNAVEQFHTGDVVNRVEGDVSAIVALLTTSLPALLVTMLQLVAAFIFFCFLDPALPWVLVSILPLLLLGGRFYTRRMRGYSRDIRRSDSGIQSVIQEGLQHRTVIKTLEQDEGYLGRLGTLQEELRTQVRGRTRFSLLARMAIATAFSGGYLVAFLWGAVRLSTGSITFGTMTAFLQLVGKVQRPVLDLSRLLPSLVGALTAVERLMELQELPAEEPSLSIRFRHTPHLRLHNVSFAYSADEPPVLHRLCLDFPPGSRTAILGKTGAGKTTLVRLLLALATPQEGTLMLSEASDGKGIPLGADTRCNFVYVPQGNTLFSGTIRSNLLMGNPHATDEELQRALHTAAASFVFDLSQGIDTPLNEQGGSLSEGQAQRIAIARALLRPGNIVLLDEATSALDPETERTLLQNLRKECAGKTCIFITHHTALAQECEQVFRL